MFIPYGKIVGCFNNRLQIYMYVRFVECIPFFNVSYRDDKHLRSKSDTMQRYGYTEAAICLKLTYFSSVERVLVEQ